MKTATLDLTRFLSGDAQQAAAWLSACLYPAGGMPSPEFAQGFPRHVELRQAAVLIALVWHAGAPTILLTRRTEHLKSHAGQISFPGGKVEAEDASVTAAALREAQEEVGLAPEAVYLAGGMEPYPTLSGFCIHPVVGVVAPPLRLVPDAGEVAEVFELPLALALDTARYEMHPFERGGLSGQFRSLRYGERFIWGATAGMLYQLAARLGG